MKVGERVAAVRDRVAAAARVAGRPADSVRILAVSKTFGPERVLDVAATGLRAFGENRIQEATIKVPAVNERAEEPLEWHFVGSLQRNKARRAAALFDVIQSVDRIELARSLDRAAGELERRLRVFVQVNVDEEEQKAGAAPAELQSLAEGVASLSHLELVGLMAIPRARPDPEAQRPAFAHLRSLLEELKLEHPGLRELSMGMSADFEVAIQEGATWIRVGTAVFGERSAG